MRNESVIYSAGSFGQKFGSGIAAALFGWILTAFGYQANAEVVSSGTIFAIKFLFLYLPILANVIQIILLYLYKLDKLYSQIIKELQERNLQNN
ncbi:MFS transporter [Brachyspira sp. SAP_772]|uniref:MFS transporter n=1 Tax=Brachyspira sp. SAP_772 TaxID=2608385 RepID=UPI0012F512A2|nr:MFS transporter [Brachyspira sp. SAP_772]